MTSPAHLSSWSPKPLGVPPHHTERYIPKFPLEVLHLDEGNKVLFMDINLKQLCLFRELGFGAFPPAFQSLVEGVVWFAFETNVGQSKNILSTWGPAASLWQWDHSAGSCWIVLSNQTGADRVHHPMNGPSDRTGSAGLSGLSA